MKRGFYIILLFCIVWIGLNSFSVAQSFEEAKARAEAVRAAKLDAIRQLGETIQGLQISSKTKVKDFIAESDEIRTSFNGFVQGFQEMGSPKYNPDGTCEVTLFVTLEQVINWVEQTSQTCPSKVTSYEVKQMRTYYAQYPDKLFTATGTGAMKMTPTSSYPTENLWQWVTPEGKLMAVRAAKVDAYRNLAEAIKGVRINSSTSVKDFVTVSDEIRASFNGFVQGVQFIGAPVYHPEGVVEVTAQVDLEKLITELSSICQKHYRGNQWNPKSFQEIRRYYKNPIIRVTGSGVPPDKYIRKPTGGTYPFQTFPPTPDYDASYPEPDKPYVPDWANRTVRVTGMGAYPTKVKSRAQAKLMAERAAELDGYRLLTEQILGLQLDSTTTVRDFVMQDDVVNAKVEGFIRGAKRVGKARDLGDGTVEVDMELYLGDMWKIIESYYRKR